MRRRAGAKSAPELRVHKDWLGLLQPVGLVVSPPALIKAQAVPTQNVAELQQRFIAVVDNPPELVWSDNNKPSIKDLLRFFIEILGWSTNDIAGAPGGPPIPDNIELILPDYNETLRPSFVVVDSMGDSEPLMLAQVLPRGAVMDEAPNSERTNGGWLTSPQARLERLLQELKIPTGLLCNGDALRLIFAPSGESSGHLTFPIAAMCEVSGRPILAALHMLLGEHRVFSAPDGRRLVDILSESRKYQAEVSNALSDQVLGALWELLRGFQASETKEGRRRSFDQTAQEEPEHIYGGLLAVLMRLIFVLYAEDEGLMPEGEVYANNYSVSGLYDRLRRDAGRYPDTMDQRYGAYAWLLSLFRLIFDGGGHGGLRLPTRHGQLFNPDEFPFLEGRPRDVMRVMDCFETFPFPENWQTDPSLETAGKTYYEFRAELMIRNDEGLTKTYNRFHDPNNHEPDIIKLRELHAAMDRAVLDAYGWQDISTDCEFLFDYEIDEENWSPRKKKPYRYRWPEAVHDEVLARLLDLNQKRYQEEVAAGLHDKKGRKKKAPKRAKTAPKAEDPQGRLL